VKYLQKVTGDGIEVSTLSFKSTTSKFLSECAAVYEKIKTKHYKIKDLKQVVYDYNRDCVKQIDRRTSDVDTIKNTTQILALLDTIDSTDPLLEDLKKKTLNNEVIPNYMVEALKLKTDKISGILIERLINLLENEQ